jgi:hypothetical protein
MKPLLALAGLTVTGALMSCQSRAGGSVHVEMTAEAVTREVRRFGINLGSWTAWGAEQLPSNIIKNPGFEGVIDRALVTVAYSGPEEFSDSEAWLGRADGFWAGATFEVLTGSAAGKTGRIRDSRKRNADGLPVFFTEGAGRALSHGDVVALTKIDDKQLPTQWWIAEPASGKAAMAPDTRPGSPGVRSLALRGGGQIFSYLDRIRQRAGRLLPVDGMWRLSFWSRASRGAPALTVEFRRIGSAPFFSQRVQPAGAWRQYEYTFDAHDQGPGDALQLSFRNETAGPAEVLLDDVSLARVSDTAGFRAEVVDVLRKLRPGYLRDWEGQLGDTFANRVAPPEGRRASRYRPGADATDFGYGLPEFLELSRSVEADPWLVVPTTFSGQECADLGRWLSGSAAGFNEVLLEFGNENWNAIFRPAGIPDPAAHGQAATRCFDQIKSAAGPLRPKLKTVVNAHSVNPWNAAKTASAAATADILAVAPYFLHSLPSGLTLEARKAALFAPEPGGVAALAERMHGAGPKLAVYEVNLHTVGGDASPEERSSVLRSAAAGAALARVMLEALRAGATRQCAYVLAGYDAKLSHREGFVELWGLMRDLTPGDRFRPTGRALLLLNRVVRGTLGRSNGEGQGVTVYGFFEGKQWSLAVINQAAEERRVEIRFPPGTSPPGKAMRLTEAGTEETTTGRSGSTLTLAVPAQSLIVLPPKENNSP